jgi:hypothetical protein
MPSRNGSSVETVRAGSQIIETVITSGFAYHPDAPVCELVSRE